nr:MAG TPA: hypothetical protein [Caudoviricetes sp.]
MINIWEYANSLPRVRLQTTTNEKYEGQVIAVWDAEEIAGTQDCIDIRVDSGAIKAFYPDEIKSIEVID